MPKDHQFIWYSGNVYKKVNSRYHSNENITYHSIVDKYNLVELKLDYDILSEWGREVFPEELTTLEVLYGI
jgi:hypothetical protein